MKRYKVYTKERGLVETDKYDDFSGLTWHREDGPAFTRYRKNGNIEREEYCINDRRHRLDGPAAISYYANGLIECEEYWRNDRLHRLDGPADIAYNENGNNVSSNYWINGSFCTKENYHTELLKLKVQSL